MRHKSIQAIVFVGLVLSVVTAVALTVPDKYTVKVPGGLAFSEFKGYESWQAISMSRNERVVAITLGNQVMIDAYKAGFPPTVSLSLTGPGWPRSIGPRNQTSFSRKRPCRASW